MEEGIVGREVDIRNDAERNRQMVDVILKAIGNNPGSLLDIGTGNGEIARQLKERVPRGGRRRFSLWILRIHETLRKAIFRFFSGTRGTFAFCRQGN